MSNDSSTGGYLVQSESALPGGLTLLQYIQQVIVGLTGFAGNKVRPKWQKNPTKFDATPEDNFCTFGVITEEADYDAYTVVNEAGTFSTMKVREDVSVTCSFYGTDAQMNASKLRDAFKISQNRDKLREAQMNYIGVSAVAYVPEIHGQVWFPRADITIILTRTIDKNFAVLSLDGASGTIEGQKSNDETENVPWNVVSEP